MVSPGVTGPVLRDGRYLYPFTANALVGYRFELELEVHPDGSLSDARFCRTEFTDVPSECPPSDWTCASAGDVEISMLPTETNVGSVHGEIHATFPEGRTVEAVF